MQKKVPMIMQSESAECGLACAAMVASHFGHVTDLITLRHRFPVSRRGATLSDITNIYDAIGLTARPIRVELDDLPYLQLPAVIHWDLNHFVVLTKVVKSATGKIKAIRINDPARGVLSVTLQELSEFFTGIAIEAVPNGKFEPKNEKRKIELSEIMGDLKGIKASIAQIFVVALSLELLALATPFYLQLVVDSAIFSSDFHLLATLALGFSLLLLLQTIFGFVRSWAIIYLSTSVNIQWMSNAFSHLMRLPIEFFEKRHLGDILSRFGAIQSIQATLTSSFLETVMDGLLAFATLAMMFAYSKMLSLVSLAFVAAYALAKISMYRPLRRISEDQLNLQAKEQSLFLESIRAIQSIKLFNHERKRQNRWLNSLILATNKKIEQQKISAIFANAHNLAVGLEAILVIYLGAHLVISKAFSLGMLFAFLAYKATFVGRILSLTDKLVEIKMLSLQTERWADVALSEVESKHELQFDLGKSEAFDENNSKTDGFKIQVRDLCFRYAGSEPFILNGVNLEIMPGESLAIVGLSGSGKTTLIKIMLGILQPTSGEVLVGGMKISERGLTAYRGAIGSVMQEDYLLSGTIAENIAFFDQNANIKDVIACAKLASIADDIAAMPMGYQTLIGDMGSSLSGGQKQRVLLARALYKKPKILFLDEATSHLDTVRERTVNQNIAHFSMTRIIIAHRHETIVSAQRIIEISDGKALDVTSRYRSLSA